MRVRRDAIFWAACGIFVAALALAGLFGDAWLLLLVGAYMLRPTLHALGFFRRLIDERELQMQYRASNVGFAVMQAGLIVVTVVLMRRGDHAWEMLVAVLMLSLAARATAGVLMTADPLIAGRRIAIGVGLLLALFGGLEGTGGDLTGIATHVLPGLGVAALGLVAHRLPRITSGALALVAAVFLGLVLRPPRVIQWGTVLGVALVAAPLVVAAFCLWRGSAGDDDRAPAPPAATALLLFAVLLGAANTLVAQPRGDARFECTPWRGSPAHGMSCRLLAADTAYGQRLPKGTILRFDSAGTYTHFALLESAPVFGLTLAGSPDGIHQDVYPDGAPRGLWLDGVQVVQGTPCRGFGAVAEFFHRTERVRFARDGRFISCRRAT